MGAFGNPLSRSVVDLSPDAELAFMDESTDDFTTSCLGVGRPNAYPTQGDMYYSTNEGLKPLSVDAGLEGLKDSEVQVLVDEARSRARKEAATLERIYNRVRRELDRVAADPTRSDSEKGRSADVTKSTRSARGLRAERAAMVGRWGR